MRFIIVIILLLVGSIVYSQKSTIVFLNKEQNKAIQIHRGGMVVIEYQGYFKAIGIDKQLYYQY